VIVHPALRAVVGRFTRLGSVLGRRALIGGAAARMAPVLYMLVRARRVFVGGAPLVAVVGSYGKTTTCRVIRAALGLAQDGPAGSAAPFAAWHRLREGRGGLATVLEAGIERPGDMVAVAAALRPEMAVVTSIGHEHLQSFVTLEGVRAEKSAMVRAVRPGGVVFLNGDDPHVSWMASVARAPVVTFGLGAGCDVRAEQVRSDWPRGMQFDLVDRGSTRTVRLPLIGMPSVYAALAAIAVARAFGIDTAIAIERLANVRPAPDRLEMCHLPSGAILLLDGFKSNWETMTTALDVMAGAPAARRIVILGGITEVPKPGHRHYRELGRRTAAFAERFIILGEQRDRYRRGARAGGLDETRIHDANGSWERAIELLPRDLGPGDVVLIKGRRVEHMERIRLRLTGREVGCRLVACRVTLTTCDTCPRLKRGWPEGQTVNL
jgi:UDP-N-acetylmuramyl pentapeptide synthase